MPVTGSMPDLSWLADAPVFIDGQQVGSFYDAVVGPAFRTVELQVSSSAAEQLEKSTAGHLNAGLSTLFPWLKLDAGAEARRVATLTRQDGQSITLQPVDSAARQLVQLSLHYLVNQPERICVVNESTRFPGAEAIAASPRMIAFVDIPPGTRFLPQAAELNDGQVVTFFSPLIEKLKRDGGTLPVAYPETTTTDEGRRERDAYWNWFADHWNANKAVQVVEDVIGAGGRPRWIAYRVIFGSGETVHLDVSARGDYDTGTFAYYFIRRGERHGLRIVASMKSEPALNLLAAYDK
ncbi:MAG: hypothetical protein ACLPKI_27775 [Streptosporangiaceae bacterium]